MAKGTVGKRSAASKTAATAAKKRKEVEKEVPTTDEVPEKAATAKGRRGRRAKKDIPAAKPSAGSVADDDASSTGTQVSTVSTRKKTLGVKRGNSSNNQDTLTNVAQILNVSGRADRAVLRMPVNTQEERDLKQQIYAILKKSELDELKILQGEHVDLDGSGEAVESGIDDSEDEADGQEHLRGANTLPAEGNFTALPTDAQRNLDDVEEVLSAAKKSPLNLTTVSMEVIEEDATVYEVAGKTNDAYWEEDATRETTLMELWEETPSLYDASKRLYMVEDRPSIIKRFATILHVPPKVITAKMDSIRNMYQRLHREAKSGSEPQGETPRQREVLRIAYFLRNHISTSSTLTCYKRRSPRGKSTPKKTQEKQLPPAVPVPEDLDLSGIPLTPMKKTALTESEAGDEGDDDFLSEPLISTKHFSRNTRLTTPDGIEASAKRSLRLTPSDPPTKEIAPTTKEIAPTTKEIAPKVNNKQAPPTKQVPVQSPKKATTAKGKGKGVAALSSKTVKDNQQPSTSTDQSQQSFVFKTAAQRKAEMVKPTEAANQSTSRFYETSVTDSDWYGQAGPSSRKKKEEASKKKEKEKGKEIAAIMLERNEQIRKMTDGLEKWRTQSQNLGNQESSEDTADMVWARSLVPHMVQMDPDIKDDFMLAVYTMAIKAKRGQWSGQT